MHGVQGGRSGEPPAGSRRRAGRGARLCLVGCGLACGIAPATRAADWTLSASTGAAWSFPTTLSIEQQGFPELRLSARYANRPFETPIHWVVRLSLRGNGGAWELQHLHHKLYLRNRPPEVERFDITHGYNVLTLNRSWRRGGLGLRGGLGVVIAHPESTVRGRRFGPGQGIFGLDQYLTGPALIVGASYEWSIGRRVFLAPEIQLSAARARVPIHDGEASAPNVAAHFLFGLGWRF